LRFQAGSAIETLQAATFAPSLAERRLGELLAEMPKSEGNRGCRVQPRPLADLGIEKTAAHRWQTQARVEEPAFEAHVNPTRPRGGPAGR
jgi:hypothetical protein